MNRHLIKISKYRPSIFQSKLDFSAPREMVLPGEWHHERTVMHSIGAALVLSAMLYLYFVSASILNVMQRKEALAQLTRLEGSIGSLEQELFALSQTATPEAGSRLGLQPVSRTQYVYRPTSVTAQAQPGAATIATNAI